MQIFYLQKYGIFYFILFFSYLHTEHWNKNIFAKQKKEVDVDNTSQ